MTETWAGEKGRFWAENAERFTRLLGEFGDALLEAADLQPGERVLDVGCGNGDVAIAAAEAVAPDGSVLGVDLSADELDVARVRAARHDVTNLELREADAGADDLGTEAFDVLISRFGVMFFDDAVAAFTHLHGALRPDARVAFVCWQAFHLNEWTHLPAQAIGSVVPIDAPAPGSPGGSAFAEADHVRGVLTRAGFRDVTFDDVHRMAHLGASADDAVTMIRSMEFARVALDSAPPDQVEEALARAREAFEEHALVDGRIELPGAAWLVRARA